MKGSTTIQHSRGGIDNEEDVRIDRSEGISFTGRLCRWSMSVYVGLCRSNKTGGNYAFWELSIFVNK